MTLTELHHKAKQNRWAVPHFNFSSLSQLQGILSGALKMRAPVVAGLSEGERDFIGLTQAVDLIQSFRKTYDIPIFLNADHSHSIETAKAAVDAGFDSIHIDMSKKPFEENLSITRQVVEYAKHVNPNIEVEGELGYLATDSSKVYTEAIDIPDDSYTKLDQAIEFVTKTGIDRFAPAIGNIHGIAANKPKIKFDLIEKLTEALPKDLTFVLHGGSGISDEDLGKIVESGFNNVHISTELRVAYTGAIKETLEAHPDDIAPYAYLKPAREAVEKVVADKLSIYHTVNVV